MDNITKQQFIAEVAVIKSLASVANSQAASALTQLVFPVVGPTVTIPTLALVGTAFKQQSDAIDKLAVLVEKVIKAS